jgi:hypothetical protein
MHLDVVFSDVQPHHQSSVSGYAVRRLHSQPGPEGSVTVADEADLCRLTRRQVEGGKPIATIAENCLAETLLQAAIHFG